MTAFRRLDKGGRIDRSKPVSFTFDGKPLSGFAGDTLASALLANGKTADRRAASNITGRAALSRPASRSPTASSPLAKGTEPNIPATTVDLIDGLVGAVAECLAVARLRSDGGELAAQPRCSSRASTTRPSWGRSRSPGCSTSPSSAAPRALARAPMTSDPDRYETRHEFCDVLVVGSGPAGLAAALTAGRSGARVVLVEQDSEFGGQLLSERTADLEAWRKAQLAELASLSNVKIRARTTAQGLYDDNFVVLVQRHDTEARCRERQAAPDADLACAPNQSSLRPARSNGRWCSPTMTGPASCWPRPCAPISTALPWRPLKRAVHRHQQ